MILLIGKAKVRKMKIKKTWNFLRTPGVDHKAAIR
ncbi:hypothetical protein HBNCFIEN_00106 [Legionella sp. PC997]|nr:hypothetical protein HBNCFIEN_00106 [Legionella sp. PC997]